MNRIDKLYSELLPQKKTAFNAYICAGDPDLETTAKLIQEFDRKGVAAIELGVPFSDPVADGPVIQQAALRALEGGTTLRKVIAMVKELRETCQIPISLMSYYNPIHRYGIPQFIADAADAGVDGLIVPDLCPEEAGDLRKHAATRDIKTIFFIAPTTPVERMKVIDNFSTGFIYCVSVTGITGARKSLPPELKENLLRIRENTTQPLVLGFGISNCETVKMMCEVADGVIVGSAICRKIEENLDQPREELIAKVSDFAGELAAACE